MRLGRGRIWEGSLDEALRAGGMFLSLIVLVDTVWGDAASCLRLGGRIEMIDMWKWDEAAGCYTYGAYVARMRSCENATQVEYGCISLNPACTRSREV